MGSEPLRSNTRLTATNVSREDTGLRNAEMYGLGILAATRPLEREWITAMMARDARADSG